MIDLYRTKYHQVFKPDLRYTARKQGFCIGIRWLNCSWSVDDLLARSRYEDYCKYRYAAERVWGELHSDRAKLKYDIIQNRRDDVFFQPIVWDRFMYLRDEQSLTLLTLSVK